MRKASLFVAFTTTLSLSPAVAGAETTVAFEPLVTVEAGKTPDASIDGWFSTTFKDSQFGLTGFWWVTRGWAEAYAGPTYAPTEWLRLGVSIGAEQGNDYGLRLRYATSLWVDKKPFAVAGTFEFANDLFAGDASVIWYDLLATVSPHDRLTVGARMRRAVGMGPYVQLNLPEAYLTLWGTWTPVDPEKFTEPGWTRFLLGATLTL